MNIQFNRPLFDAHNNTLLIKIFIKMNGGTNNGDSSISLSIVVPEEDPYATIGYVSELSADEQDEDAGEVHTNNYVATKTRHTRYRSPSLLRRKNSFTSQNMERRDSIDTCDRLYNEAKEQQLKHAIRIREKIDQENKVEPRKLKLATERSYTPMKTRPTNGNIHDHLYRLAKKKELKLKEEQEEMESSLKELVISPKELKEVSGRLYKRSLRLQEDGKKKREEIEKKHAPRAPTPSRRIPLSQASAMYERGLSHLAKTERKIEEILNIPRESSFPKMKTQRRSSSTSRARSQTPSRRNSERSTTPSRRQATSNEVNNTFIKNPQRERKMLPPTALRIRDQSTERA